MFDAGSAIVTLTGRVVKEPFDAYGRLVEAARTQKEHAITLGARTLPEGFQKFMASITGAKDATREAEVSIKGSIDGIASSTNKLAVVTGRDMGAASADIRKFAASYGFAEDTVKRTADVISREDSRIISSINRMAGAQTAATDKWVKDEEEKAAATRRTAAEVAGAGGGGGRGRSYVNPMGGGGAGASSEAQAKKTTAAWKEGFSTLATVGKWTTAAIGITGAVAVKWAADFQRQMELVRTQVGYTQKQVRTFSNEVLDLAPKVGVAPNELAKGLYHVTSVLQGRGGTNEAMRILKLAAEGAKVGMANMEDVSSALMAIFKSGLKDIHSTGEAMGVMNDIVGQGNLRMEDLSKALSTGLLAAARNAHIGLRDVGAALDTMTSRGVPAEQAATRLRTTLTLIASPTSKAVKALGEFGLSSTQLADDMQKHGLVYALEDLQRHMNQTFPPGRKLTVDQERAAITKYGQQLEAAGVKGKTLQTDLSKFKDQLDQTGSSAVKQSAAITSAFGGSRMGTTMALLLQNVDDVHTRFDKLNKADAAGRFQTAWQRTQKDFSVQASQLSASVRELGIRLGDWLIPKVKALVVALIDAGKWLGRHKALAEALAVAFGTLLAGAVAAFFTKLLIGAGRGLKSILGLSRAIFMLPKTLAESGAKMGASLDGLIAKWRGVETAAGDAIATEESGGVAGGGPGGPAGVAGGLAGAIEGMITGVRGTMAPGSVENPLAVVVLDSMGGGGIPIAGGGGALAKEESTLAKTEGGVLLPPGVAREVSTAETVAKDAGFFSKAGGFLTGLPLIGGLASKAGGVLGLGGEGSTLAKLGGFGGRLLGGAGLAGMGLIGGQLLSSVVGGKTGSVLGSAATGAGIGAGLASVVPVVGTGVGALIGGALGAGANLLSGLFGGGPSQAQKDQAKVANFAKEIKGMGSASNLSAGQVAKLDAQAERLAKMKDITASQREGLKKLQGALADVGIGRFLNELQGIKDISGVAIFDHWVKDFKKAGPQMKDEGARAALLYAEGLQEKGDLPKGSVQKLIKQMEAQFPPLAKYLKDQGLTTDKELATTLKLNQSRASLQASVKYMETQFGYVPKNAKVTMDNMGQQFHDGMAYLKHVMATGSTQARKDAEAQYILLQNHAHSYFGKMSDNIAAQMDTIKGNVTHKSAIGAVLGAKSFQNFAAATTSYFGTGQKNSGKAMSAIISQLNNALKELGQPKLTPLQVSTVTLEQVSNQFANAGVSAVSGALGGLTGGGGGGGGGGGSGGGGGGGGGGGTGLPGMPGFHATGGVLPGSEFGLGDVMTLVDPQGRPRAKMAGDEAIFNRHQMPYVEAGLQMLGFRGAQDLWQHVNTPHGFGYEKGGLLPRYTTGGRGPVPTAGPGGGTQGYVYPFVGGVSLGRTDMGVDADMPIGSPIGAIGDAIMGPQAPNWYHGQPIITWTLTSGPARGKRVYLAEQIIPMASPGQHVSATQAVARFAPSGTGIEMGWAGPGTETLAQATTGYTEGQVTPAGTSFRTFLTGLAHGTLSISGGGGAFGAIAIPKIKAPKVTGKGPVPAMVQTALDRETRAANTYLQKHAPLGTSAYGVPSIAQGPVEKMIYEAGSKLGLSKAAIAGLIGNAYQESSLNPNLNMPGGKGLFSWNLGVNPNAAKVVLGNVAQQVALAMSETSGGVPAFNRAATSPAAAAIWFEQTFERAGIPDMGNRISAAQAAYARGYAGGGQLPGFASGGGSSSWPALPSGVGYLPGFRPPRVRRGRGGLHTTGGTHSTHSGTSTSTRSSGRSSKPKTETRPRQTISQSVADTLTHLGFKNFVTDQNTLGTLDNQYSNQENLFSLFSTSLSKDQLDVLQGIREKEWDILHKEYLQLPKAIDRMTKNVDALAGRDVPGHYHQTHKRPLHDGRWTHHSTRLSKDSKGHRVWVPDHQVGGVVPALTKAVTDTENEITKLQHDVTLETRKAATVRHNVSAAVMALSDKYASAVAGYLQDITVIQDKKYQNSQRRISLGNQIRNLPSGGSTSLSLNQIVSGVMSGALPTTGTTSNPAKKGLQQQVSDTHASDSKLTHDETVIRRAIHAQLLKKQAAERQYRQQGFDAAWAITLKKWSIEDRIYRLQQKLKQLKASLKTESDAMKADQNALQTLTNWSTGGLQGTGSIADSLEAIAFDMLGLYQQGADLPTPDRTQPTLETIEKFLTSMGLQIPPGLKQGITAATTQAFQDFQTFQATRADLFSQFGSNFVPAGMNPFSSVAGAAAGVQYYGAAAGANAGVPGAYARGGGLGMGGMGSMKPGETTINIHQNFAAGPPDPHTYSAGLVFELGAMA